MEASATSIWLCVSEDRGSERFWKGKLLRRDIPAGEIPANIENLLQQAFAIRCSWKGPDLELAKSNRKENSMSKHPGFQMRTNWAFLALAVSFLSMSKATIAQTATAD